MPNWKQAAKRFFANSDPNGEFVHCADEGVTPSNIDAAENKLKIAFPEELRQFYGQINGIGLTNDETELPNFIPSIEQLPDFVKSARSAFPASHRQYAKRYLPVVDWENGDTSGYFLDDDGVFHDHFFMFSHELCINDKTQDVNEFVTHVADDLYSFLSG